MTISLFSFKCTCTYLIWHVSVVYLGDHSKLKALEAYDADFSAADYSGRTALHVAASTGQETERGICTW